MEKKHKTGSIAAMIAKRKGNGGPADWEEVDREALVEAIAAAARTGGALRFGYTRDGHAYSIGVYGDGEPYTIYVRPDENLDTVLGDITTGFREMAFGQPVPKSEAKKG